MSAKARGRFDSRETVHAPVGTRPEDNLTQQSFKEETDINYITSRYLPKGMLPQMTGEAKFGDFSSIDFLQMQNSIADIDSQFQTLPAKLRRRFSESPYQLIRWLENQDNHEEAVKLGLLPGPPPVEPPKAGEQIQVQMPLQASQDAPAAGAPVSAPSPT